MARIASITWELNSLTLEGTTTQFPTGLSIDSTTKRTGTYSLKCIETAASHAGWIYWNTTLGTALGSIIYTRTYMYITTLPASASGIIGYISDAFNDMVTLLLNSDGSLSLVDLWGSATGTSSSTLSLNTWYKIEYKIDMTTPSATTITIQVDGVNVISATSNQSGNGSNIQVVEIGVGINSHSTIGVVYHDDIAINDSTGSFQNSYPGTESLVCLRPNAAGDNNSFTVQVGGTAGAGNNYTRVNEVTPDDSTTYNADAVGGDADDFNIDDTPASIGSSDTINVVSVGIRYSALIASLESSLKVRCKKVSGGTISKSAAITPNTVAWDTNANAAPRTYPLTLYQDPDGGSWTKATLDTAQIGYEISTGNTNSSAISTIWMTVGYTPAAVAANTWIGSNLTTLKVG